MHVATRPPCRQPGPRRGNRSARSRAGVEFFLGERRDADAAAKRVFGRALLPWEYAALAGAPDDALVEVGTLGGRLYIELRGPREQAYRAFLLVGHRYPSPVILCDGFQILRRCAQGCGLGLRILSRQLECARKLRVSRIELVAGRRSRENGYYTWPRYGFDGPLPPNVEHRLPRRLRQARTVLDLMECKSGREWWKEHGESVLVAFDVSSRSRSWDVFCRYARQREDPAE